MRLIDADALRDSLLIKDTREVHQFCYPCKKILQAIDEQPTIESPTDDALDEAYAHGFTFAESRLHLTTEWLGSYSPYTCEKCGFHVDSKTKYCPDCGRKASNYEVWKHDHKNE